MHEAAIEQHTVGCSLHLKNSIHDRRHLATLGSAYLAGQPGLTEVGAAAAAAAGTSMRWYLAEGGRHHWRDWSTCCASGGCCLNLLLITFVDKLHIR
jgi:hypothetical protein